MPPAADKGLGNWTIVGIMVVFGVSLGTLLGLYGQRLGISGYSAVIIALSVSLLSNLLVRRRRRASRGEPRA